MSLKKRIILGVTGSIAAYKSADIIKFLKKNNLNVSVVMTKAAESFIGSLTLASFSGEEVFCENSQEINSRVMAHINLARKADVLLVAPATANTISKMANGLADNLLTATVLATKAPIIVAPAMNTVMYENNIFQENCLRLKKNGVIFVDPVEGELACGEIGDGHIAETEDIVKKVIQVLNV